MRIAVLGAGPSGLALCHYLRQALGSSLELTLVESSGRVGGWLRSERRDGFLFERGPHSFRPSTPAGKVVLELVDDLGLRDEAIAPAKGSGRRFLYLDGRIQEVAPSLRTPLGRTLLRGALRDLCTAPRAAGAFLDAAGYRRFEAQLAAATTPGERRAIRAVLDASDESVASFVGRRFGTDLAEQAADAMVAGIFAGDARRADALAHRSRARWRPRHGDGLHGLRHLSVVRADFGVKLPRLPLLPPRRGWRRRRRRGRGLLRSPLVAVQRDV